MSKYHNVKTKVDGITFASRHEAYRYCELKMMERTGLIHDLKLQVPFELIPKRKGKDGKVIQRAIKYIADFTYTTCTGKEVVEDAKGCLTDVYKIKKALMFDKYGIEIREV